MHDNGLFCSKTITTLSPTPSLGDKYIEAADEEIKKGSLKILVLVIWGMQTFARQS